MHGNQPKDGYILDPDVARSRMSARPVRAHLTFATSHGGFVWTDEATATLKRMRDEGCPASEIGARLGITRNAVLGRVFRLGLASKGPPGTSHNHYRWSGWALDTLQEMTQAGISAHAIATIPGMPSHKTVSLRLAQMGLKKPVRPRKERSPKPPKPRSYIPDFRTEPALPIDPTKVCGLLELTKETCRYPLWADDPANGQFCGCQVVQSLPYCHTHSHICFGERRP